MWWVGGWGRLNALAQADEPACGCPLQPLAAVSKDWPYLLGGAVQTALLARGAQLGTTFDEDEELICNRIMALAPPSPPSPGGPSPSAAAAAAAAGPTAPAVALEHFLAGWTKAAGVFGSEIPQICALSAENCLPERWTVRSRLIAGMI